MTLSSKYSSELGILDDDLTLTNKSFFKIPFEMNFNLVSPEKSAQRTAEVPFEDGCP